MKIPRGMLSVLALIAANLYPLVGVRYLNWDPTVVLMLYWVENLVLGFYNVLKMEKARNDPAVPESPRIKRLGLPSYDINGRVVTIDPHDKRGMIRFFCIHYGGFCLVHGFFLIVLIVLWRGPQLFRADRDFSFDPVLIAQVLGGGLCLFASHGVSFVENYLKGGEYLRTMLLRLLYQPYGRIVVLHIVVLGGMFLAVRPGGGLVTMVSALVVLKILLDLVLHLRSHRRPAGSGGGL